MQRLSFLPEDIQQELTTISDSMIKRWLSDYSEEFMIEQLISAHQWWIDTKHKRKSFTLFCNNWLKRSFKERHGKKDAGKKLHEFLEENRRRFETQS